MAANDFAAQNGTEKLSTNALSTVNGTSVAADLIEVQRVKSNWGADGVMFDTSKAAPLPVENQSTQLWVTATGASGAAVTATLPAPAAGLFHYVTAVEISLYAAAARTGAATPVIVTTTNLPGSPAFNFTTAQAIGAIDREDLQLANPIKSSAAATATTIVCPVATSGIWRVNVGYYTAA